MILTNETADQPKVYAFPGLGTDWRMYGMQAGLACNLHIPDWIRPEKNETMHHYAGRLAENMDTSEPFYLMGVSLGGMMCMELAKYIRPERIILISSCKTRAELPPQIKSAKILGGAKLVPTPLMRRAIRSWSRYFSDLPHFQKRLFDNMVMSVDGEFLMWAATAITRWKNETIHDNILHIHGTRDQVLPYKYVSADVTIMGGTHYMVGSKYAEINELLDHEFRLCCTEPV